MIRRHLPILAATLALACAGCATPPDDPAARTEFDKTNDPIEPTNRAIYDANDFANRNALRPVADAYDDWVPQGVRTGIHNALTNLKAPRVLVNDMLQGNPGQAWTTVERFAVNTTAGGLGVFDVASGWDLPNHDADFGQTFGVWGVGEGPFIELPLLGPSNARDAVGTAIGMVTDPFTFVGGGAITYIGYARTGLNVVDQGSRTKAALDDVQKNSIDPYATLRSVYRQRRDALIEQGVSPDTAKGRIDIYFPGEVEP